MSSRNKEVLITTQSTGTLINDCIGYKVLEKVNSPQIQYSTIDIPANSTYKIIRFNVASKRAVVFLDVKNITTQMVELDYSTLLNNSVIENQNIFKNIECILINTTEKYVVSKEILIYSSILLLTFICSFLLGKLF